MDRRGKPAEPTPDKLGCVPDPPENLGQDSPIVSIVQDNGLVVLVFWL
jgi:hypothetical protein